MDSGESIFVNKVIIVKCPQCKLEFNYYAEKTRPFCSERCRQVDLGHWFNESYSVPSEKQTDDDTETWNEESEDSEKSDESEKND